MNIHPELAELRAFCLVADKSSFRAAAEALFISQPALSRRIERLEAALRARLFERTSRRVSLSAAGARFLVHARAVLAELEAGVAGLHDEARRRDELVTLACVPSLANHLLPRVLADFARARPATRIRLIDESAPAVLRAVVEGQADFALNFLGGEEPAVEFRRIGREKYALAVHPSHALAAREAVAWGELAGERFVSVAPSSGNRVLIDHAFSQAAAPRPPIQVEANHVEAVLALVEGGLGVAAVPRFALRGRSAARIVAVPLVRPSIARTWGLVVRQGHRPHPAAEALQELLVDAVRRAARD